MTREKFFELTGEYPEDFFGEDWKNLIDEWSEDFYYEHPDKVKVEYDLKKKASQIWKEL